VDHGLTGEDDLDRDVGAPCAASRIVPARADAGD
jgi:hypothetical protein